MALANSRPLQIPTLENEILHNSNSPIFQLSSMGFTTRADTISNPGTDLVGNQSNMSLDDNSLSGSSFSSSQETKTLKSKKDSGAPKKDNPLLEISKLIPVTGERPKPENRDSPLDDDVLHAVFVILWEMDPNQQGMTVKQLCDLLLQKHPDMSNLSTKLSNLISAKLNAYVKKIEKGEKTLIYALSREWSNSSPRRMLYIYRGILSPDYKEHAQAVTMKLKSQLERSGGSNDFNSKKKKDSNNNQLANNDSYSDSVADMKNLSSNSSFSKNLNVGNLAFSLSPEFNIPYSTSPVSLNLSPSIGSSQQQLQSPSVSTPVLKNKNSNKKRSYPDDDANDIMTESKKNKAAKPGKQTKCQSSSVLSTPKKVPSSTSLSTFANSKIISPDSSVSHNTPSSTYVTAAAAAPRLSKLLPKNGFKKNSRSSSELAAIHKVISTQTPIESSSESSVYSSSSSSPISNTATGSTESLSDHSSSQDNETESNLSSQEPRNEVTNWMKIVRNGFLTRDIESPESITLDDLENIFN
ncbi:gds1p [Saccharomyces arboricola H-6]|uniref:Gds1p n=1 Tax=Saccharomyces arboricola (strain H-6 / AS 2.3317 / CBS 10644) TaxID=1160507 RepID=J8LHK9_SACAR|nr:gds1p [Saccharomyces arboricola H-6]